MPCRHASTLLSIGYRLSSSEGTRADASKSSTVAAGDTSPAPHSPSPAARRAGRHHLRSGRAPPPVRPPAAGPRSGIRYARQPQRAAPAASTGGLRPRQAPLAGAAIGHRRLGLADVHYEFGFGALLTSQQQPGHGADAAADQMRQLRGSAMSGKQHLAADEHHHQQYHGERQHAGAQISKRRQCE